MEKKIRDAFDQLYMGGECVDRIEKELCKPQHKKLYTSEAAAPSYRGWLKAVAALAAVAALVLCLGMVGTEYREAQSISKIRAALEELQSRENVHIVASSTVEGIEGQEGADNEYLQQGEVWLRVGEMYFTDRTQNYTVGNLSTGGKQYRFGHAGDHNWDASFNWTVASNGQLWERLWLMEFDLDAATITSLEEQDGIITIVFDGNPRPDSDTVYETCTQVWYLDEEGRLTGLTEEATYQAEGAAVHSVTEITVTDSDEAFITYLLDKNLRDIRQTAEDAYLQEQMDLELELIYQEAQQNITKGLRYTVGNITYSYSGWGNDLQRGAFYDTDRHTPWTTFANGRVVFSANGESFDITDRFSETEPFTYIYTDQYYITHYIAIGGTAENPGYLEMCKASWCTDPVEGNLGGFGVNTWNNEADVRCEWEQKAKETFLPYGVYWVS